MLSLSLCFNHGDHQMLFLPVGILGIAVQNVAGVGFASSFRQAAVTGGWPSGASAVPPGPSRRVSMEDSLIRSHAE